MGLYHVDCPTCGASHQWFSGNPDQRCAACIQSNKQPNSIGEFIAFDCETGGVGGDVSLLTVYFAILDKNLQQIDELDLVLKPNNNEPYKIEAQALEVNKINLIEHDKAAISYSEGGQQLVKLLKKYSKGGKNGLIPLGHNVTFDINSVVNNLIGRKAWNQFVSYKIQDTQVVGRFLQIAGFIDKDESMSVFNQGKMFGISLQGEEHTAKYDTLLTIEVYKRQIEMMRRR